MMSHTQRFTMAAAVSAALALTLGGCTSDKGDKDKGATASSSVSGSTEPSKAKLPGRDVSAELLDEASWGEPIATIERPAEGSVGARTVKIYSLKTGATGTVLRWTATAASGLPKGTTSRDWPELPLLVDPATKVGYRVSTFSFPGEAQTYCLCPGHSLLDETPSPSSAYYPPLPDGVKEVTLTWQGWPDTTVPVTR